MRTMTSVGFITLIACCGIFGCGGSGATTPLYTITSPANEAEDVADPVAFAGTGPTTHNATSGPTLWVGEYDEDGENITSVNDFQFTVGGNGTWGKAVSGLNGATLHAACVGTESSYEIAISRYEAELPYNGPPEFSAPIKFTTADVE